MSLHPDRILDTFSCWISFWALLYQVSCLCVFLRSVLLFSRVCVDILSCVDWTFKHSTVLCVQFCYFKMLLQSVHRTPLVSSTYRLYLQMSCGSRIVVEKRCGFLAVQCRQVVSLLSWSSRLLSSERCTLLSKQCSVDLSLLFCSSRLHFSERRGLLSEQCRQDAFCEPDAVIVFQSLQRHRGSISLSWLLLLSYSSRTRGRNVSDLFRTFSELSSTSFGLRTCLRINE